MNIILFNEGEERLPLNDKRCSHILRVLHLKEGDEFKAGYINGRMGKAKLVRIGEAELELSFSFTEEPRPLFPLVLIVAQVRPICMRRILREAVSLGVSELILPVSDLGEKSYLSSSLYKNGEYKEILLDGAIQAGSSLVSECSVLPSLESAIAKAGEGRRLLFDNVIGSVALSSLDLENERAIIAIGPERGWSDRERELLRSSGFSPVLLGSRILRTETACSAGVALTLSRMKLL